MCQDSFTVVSEAERRFGNHARLGLAVGVSLLLLVVALSGCAREEREDGEEVEIGKRSFSFSQDAAPFDIFSEYRIAPGDVLDVLYHVNTWSVTGQTSFKIAVDHEVSVNFVNVPELDETQTVRPDGTITLPYIGPINVVGMTVQELTSVLKQEYRSVLREPELYVTVPQFRRAIEEFKRDLHTAPRGLSRLVSVRPDGYATFAMLGDEFVAGKSLPEVSRVLNERYTDILPELSVDLFLESHSGSLVYVLGEVGSPGSYPILRYTSILEALSLAGGPTPRSNLEKVIVIRRYEDKLIGTQVNAWKALHLEEDSALFYLQPDDIVYVPLRGLSMAAIVADELSRITMFRGWGPPEPYSWNDIYDLEGRTQVKPQYIDD